MPSGETPWSLLQRVAKPVSIVVGSPPDRGDAEDPASAVVDQRTAVVQPVGRLDPVGRDVDHASIRRGHRLRLEACYRRPADPTERGKPRQLHIREHRLLRHVVVVRADAEADVERLLESDPHRGSREFQDPAPEARYIRTYFPLFSMPQPLRGRDVRLNLVRGGTLGLAELQRGQPVAVQRGINIGRVGIQALADHQARLAMRLGTGAEECDVGRQREVARSLLPGVVERVAVAHMFCRCRPRCISRGRVVNDRPGMRTVPTSPWPSKIPIARARASDDNCENAKPRLPATSRDASSICPFSIGCPRSINGSSDGRRMTHRPCRLR